MAKNGQNLFSWIINEPDFFRKNGRARFLPLTQWTFMPSLEKILRAVIRETCSPGNYPWIPTLTSTDVENCNMAQGHCLNVRTWINLNENRNFRTHNPLKLSIFSTLQKCYLHRFKAIFAVPIHWSIQPWQLSYLS